MPFRNPIICLFMLIVSQNLAATELSVNEGRTLDESIAYRVSLEENLDGQVLMKIRLTNCRTKTLYLAGENSPWRLESGINIKIFSEIQDAPNWESDWTASITTMLQDLVLKPGDSIDGEFPVEYFFSKISLHRSEGDIYVYWSFPITLGTAPPRGTSNESSSSLIHFKRIGGMLRIPAKPSKGTDSTNKQ